jgi:hypothetical protein
VSVTFAVASGGGSITGGSTTTNASGIATVGSWTLGTTAGPNTLTATATGLSGSPVTFTATGTAGAAAKLAFSVQPTDVQAAVGVITPAVVVSVLDANDNLVTGSSASITIAVASDPNGGLSILTGTLVRTASGGTATFDDLGIDLVGSGFTLGVSSSGLTGATSSAFDVTP